MQFLQPVTAVLSRAFLRLIIIIIIIMIIIIIIGATGTISKSFRKYVSNIPGHHDVKELQKGAILGTAHILRKVLT
jgi:vancomycin permeability regulator SanA